MLQAPSVQDAKLVAWELPSGHMTGEYSQDNPSCSQTSPVAGSTTGQVTGQAQQSSPMRRRGAPSLHKSSGHIPVKQLSGQAQQSSPIGRRGMPSLQTSSEQAPAGHLLVHVLGASMIRGLAQSPTHRHCNSFSHSPQKPVSEKQPPQDSPNCFLGQAQHSSPMRRRRGIPS